MDTHIIKQVNEAIEANATADKLQELTTQLRPQLHALRIRLEAISCNGGERRKAVQSGEVSALQKLEAKQLELVPQIEVITALQTRLATALMVAKAKDAAHTMKTKYKGLGTCLDAETKAVQALNLARRDTDSQLGAMTQARMDMNRCANTGGPRFEADAADGRLLSRYLEVREIHPKADCGWGRDVHTVNRAADGMGLNPPRASEAA